MVLSCKFFPHVSEIPTLAYNRENSVIIKNINSLYPFSTSFLFDFGTVSRAGADPGGVRTLEKNKIFWRKIVIFHTKYPNNFRPTLRSAQFF
jgi:hypothetical protein